MKALSVVLLLLASVAFVLVGCSDNSAVPVTPTDQSAQGAPSLEKKAITSLTMYHYPIPPFPLPYPANPAIRKVPGGIWHLKDVELHEAVRVKYEDETVESGTMLHYLSSTMNAAGEGPVHGSFTMTMASGAVWEGTYQGYRSFAPPAPPLPPGFTLPSYLPPYPAYTYELPLKVVAHGRGGNVDGMKLSAIDVIRAYETPPQAWYGISEGSFK
jgi:hypothetical protein